MKRPSASLLAIPLGLLIGLGVAGVPSRTAVPPSVTTTTTSTSTTTTSTTTTTTVAVGSTDVLATTPATPASTADLGTLPLVAPDQVRVVVANGSGRANLGRAYTELMAAKGYPAGTAVTALQRADVSVLYVREGFEREGAAFLQAMNLADVAVARFPASPVGPSDDQADLLLLIGRDRAN
jgi:hypothetical protein